jgi:hypothetical protein
MVISATPTSGYSLIIGFVAAVGLATGLASMFRILMRQQQELLRLGNCWPATIPSTARADMAGVSFT